MIKIMFAEGAQIPYVFAIVCFQFAHVETCCYICCSLQPFASICRVLFTFCAHVPMKVHEGESRHLQSFALLLLLLLLLYV